MANLKVGRARSKRPARPRRVKPPASRSSTLPAASEPPSKVYRGAARYAFLEGVAAGFAHARGWL